MKYLIMLPTPEFGKFAGKIFEFDTKLKQANLATNHDLNAISQRVNINKEKKKQKNHKSLIYFLGNIFW